MAIPTISVPQFSGVFAPASIPNAALVNSSVTVTAGTGLAGGGAVALGGTISISLPNTGPGAGVIGGAGQHLVSITLDAQGRITAATAAADAAAGFYQTVQAAGVDQTQEAKLNFGTGFSVADDGANSRTTVSLASTVLSGSLNSGRIPVANGSNSLTDSSLTWSGSTLDSTLATVVIGGTMTTLQWAAGTSKTINVATSAADTAGTTLNIASGAGGAASATGAGTGGNLTINASQGGNGSGALGGGTGGTGQLSGGAGGQGTASALGGTGGAAAVRAGSAGLNNGFGGGTAGTASIRGGTGATPSGANNTGSAGGATQVLGAIPGDGSATATGGNAGVIQILGQAGGADGGAGGGVGSTITVTPGGGRNGLATSGNAGTASGALNITGAQNGNGGTGAGTNGNGGAGASGSLWTWGGNKGGDGGAGVGTGNGGNGGAGNSLTITTGAGGQGGTGTVPGTSGKSGDLTLTTAGGGLVQGSNGGAGSGDIVINNGASTGSATAGAVKIGQTNTSAVAIGRSGITTTVTGGLSQLTGAVALTANAASSFTTSAGALTITAAAASTWRTTAGNLTVDAAAFVNVGTSNATQVTLGRSGINVIVPGGIIRALTANSNTDGTSFSIGLNNGGPAGSTFAGGAGGGNLYTSGQGGAAGTAGGEVAGLGGATSITGGQGGNGAASGNGPANGGNAFILGGTAGTVTSGFSGANGGGVFIRGGALSGTGTNGNIFIGDSNTAAITIGSSTLTTAPLFNTATGTTYTWQFNGTDNLVLSSSILQFKGTANATYNVGTAATDTAGKNLTVNAGNAGSASASNGQAGGTMQINAGTGAAATATRTAGAGGVSNFVGGTGGAGASANIGGTGGQAAVAGGTGGAGTATALSGPGGQLLLSGGSAGASGGAGLGAAGGVSIRGGNGSTFGVIAIGDANTSTITLAQTTTLSDTKTLTVSYNGNITGVSSAGNAWLTAQNTTAATNVQTQSSPGQEWIGRGWSYRPGVIASASNMVRVGTTVTVTTTAAHGFVTGQNVYVYPGEVNFSQGSKGPITVTGTTTFTYTEAGTATSSAGGQNIFDDTGTDQAVKVMQVLQPQSGVSFSNSFSDQGMAAPAMVYYRSGYPNNGAYNEWFRIAATDPYSTGPAGFNTDGGVTIQTLASNNTTPGSFLSLQPSRVALVDDHSLGFYTVSSPSYPSTAGFLSYWGGLVFSSGSYGRSSAMGAAIGLKNAPWYDSFAVRGSFQNLASGDVAAPLWSDGGTAWAAGPTWFSDQGAPVQPYGLSVYGGGSRFQQLLAPSGLTATATGGSGATYTYFVVAVDRNGFATTSTSVTVSGGASLSSTVYNTIGWFAVPGASYYDVYQGSVSQTNYLGSVQATTPSTFLAATTLSFKHTGVAKYFSGSDRNIQQPAMTTSTWSVQAGASVVVTNGFVKLNGSTTVTLTFVAAHGLKVGDTIVITSLSNTIQFTNGTYTVASVVSPTVITYTDPVSNASGSTQTTTGTFAVTRTYGVYAVDADGRVIASTTATGNGAYGANISNYWVVTWTPVGGAAKYYVCRDNLSSPIAIQTQIGVQIPTGTAKTLSKTASTTVTVTDAAGHGFMVGDSFTISASGDSTHFTNITTTVTAVLSATQFQYVDAPGGVFTGSTTATYTGVLSVVTASITDYGYTPRTIGAATRNSTADILVDGRITVRPQTTPSATALSTPTPTPQAVLTASQLWQDSAGITHSGVDAFGFPSLGSRFELRENWMMNQTLAASQTGAVITGGLWKYTTSVNATGFTNTSGLAAGFPCASGLNMGTGTASGNSTIVQSIAAIFNPAQLTNLYAIAEFPVVLSTAGSGNNYTVKVGLTNGAISGANPLGYYFQKASADTFWQCVCDNGAGNTTTVNSTTLAPSSQPVSGAVQILRIEYYGSATVFGAKTVVFKIDGVIAAVIQTNVYSGNTVWFMAYATATNTITQQSLGIGPTLIMYNMVASPAAP
jgi:hypothetical protein